MKRKKQKESTDYEVAATDTLKATSGAPVAQVYATLAIAQAIDRLAEAIKKNGGGDDPLGDILFKGWETR